MQLSAEDKQHIQSLEAAASQKLDDFALSSTPVDALSLSQLNSIAEAAAKIAFGCGEPGLLSVQMHRLIAWTDHLDDRDCAIKFQTALLRRPLDAPSWHRGA